MLTNFKYVHTFSTLDIIDSIALSFDGKIIACGQSEAYTLKEQFITIFDTDKKQQICEFHVGRYGTIAELLAISPNKREIVWSTSGQISIGDLTTGKEICRIWDEDENFRQNINTLIITNEEKLIDLSSQIAKAFDVTTGQ